MNDNPESLRRSLVQSSVQSVQESPHSHNQFETNFTYLLTILGMTVGYGCFWRFPYLIYKNGGGAFLIPYSLAMAFIGVPLLYLECSLGQIHQRSIPFAFARVNRGLKFVGVAIIFTLLHLIGFYNILLVYSYRYLVSSFNIPLPFENQTPEESYYFAETVLHKSSSITDYGALNPTLFIIYCLSFVICYLVIKNGVKFSGKIITITAIMPYAFFVILVLRGVFLDGANEGLKYLFYPKWGDLFKVQIWIDAVVQVFFQLGIATASVFNLSSLKPRNSNLLKPVYTIPLGIFLCGMLCSLTVFMYLGHFCKQEGLSIDNLSLSGIQLSFNIFPKALTILPGANLWVFVFFVTLIFLGIDTQFGNIEGLYCYLDDEFGDKSESSQKRFFTLSRLKPLSLVSLTLVFAPLLCSEAGIFYVEYFNSFIFSLPLSINIIAQTYTFTRIFPLDQVDKEIEKRTGFGMPIWIKSVLKSQWLLSILLGNLVLSFVQLFLTYKKYTFGFFIMGWVLCLYPYLIAFIYWRYRREDKNRTTFREIKRDEAKSK